MYISCTYNKIFTRRKILHFMALGGVHFTALGGDLT